MKGIDSVILLLAGLWVLSLGGCFAAEAFFRQDAVFFTSIVGMSSTILGALMLKITGKEHPTMPGPDAEAGK